jgi:hypothetical protein
MPREDDLLASIRRAVGESLRDSDPNLARVAGKIVMGQRTLAETPQGAARRLQVAGRRHASAIN